VENRHFRHAVLYDRLDIRENADIDQPATA
jgi:hypothetical protein